VTRSERGQAVIEFAIIAPVAFMLLFGLIAGCFLFYQNSALHDGASAGSRAASIETSLVQQVGTTTTYCESGSPTTIEQAIATAAPALNVDTTAGHVLCGTSTGTDATSITQLTQLNQTPGSATITVTCGGNCSAPSTVTVAVTYNAQGLAIPLSLNYTLSATSTAQMIAP
jgi:Flp pilus assembly protein TadG